MQSPGSTLSSCRPSFGTGRLLEPRDKDADGDFVVIWNSLTLDGLNSIFGRRYDSSGASRGSEFQVNAFTTDSQTFPSTAMEADGDFSQWSASVP